MALSCDISPKYNEKKELIIKKWTSIVHKPKCIVFDLDMTLWPFLIDHKVLFPLRKINHHGNEKIFDHSNTEIKPFEDVPLILETLRNSCIGPNEFLAIASRATAGEHARQLIDLFNWTNYFGSIQIYSGTKQKHMKRIFNDLKLKSFDEILFFDDSKLNLETTKSLGVIGHKVSRHYGLNVQEFLDGLDSYSSKCFK
ncbi:magnesium-dependent phosphatase 1-like [Brachionus plicatilis]|uniref:Magnesium-dependent phosphatase 1-like n=1 Tax=Brachionus plicatilis TaxID=10195 RepID=A0A3M7S3I2_BRAPC|nr:magnesium-dependent phosphatase 1-like [Brachionus plicatilis]